MAVVAVFSHRRIVRLRHSEERILFYSIQTPKLTPRYCFPSGAIYFFLFNNLHIILKGEEGFIFSNYKTFIWTNAKAQVTKNTFLNVLQHLHLNLSEKYARSQHPGLHHLGLLVAEQN